MLRVTVPGPAQRAASWSEPTAVMRPWRIATACAAGRAGSIVMTLALVRIRSAGPCPLVESGCMALLGRPLARPATLLRRSGYAAGARAGRRRAARYAASMPARGARSNEEHVRTAVGGAG